jgi:hypothetical protein
LRIRLIRNDENPDRVAIEGPFASRRLCLISDDYVRELRSAGVPRRGWTDCVATVEAGPRSGLVLWFVADGLPEFKARPTDKWWY